MTWLLCGVVGGSIQSINPYLLSISSSLGYLGSTTEYLGRPRPMFFSLLLTKPRRLQHTTYGLLVFAPT